MFSFDVSLNRVCVCVYVNTGVLLGVSVAAISCGFRERGVLSRSFGREGGVSEFSWKTLIQSLT